MPSVPRPSTAPPNRLGIRVVWASAFFGPEERAAIEEVLAAILADGLIETFTQPRPERCHAGGVAVRSRVAATSRGPLRPPDD